MTQYRKMFNDSEVGPKLQDKLVTQLNIMMMNLMDPDCSYASFGALDSSMDAIKKWKKLSTLQMKLGLTPAVRMLGREYRTTPMMLLLMNSDGSEPIDPKTRVHLQRCTSDSVLASVAGVPGEERSRAALRRVESTGKGLAPMPRPKLDTTRRAALYRTAGKRFGDLGSDVISTNSRDHSKVSHRNKSRIDPLRNDPLRPDPAA